jgi:hypothetical protein
MGMGQAMINSEKEGWGLVGDMAKGLAVGAAAGAVGGALGSGFAQLGVAWGVSGVLPGMAYGAATGAITGAVTGGLTSSLNGGSFMDGAGQGALYGAAFGALIGGISGGVDAYHDGNNVWWGNNVQYGRSQWSLINSEKPIIDVNMNMPQVNQIGDLDCNYATMGSIAQKLGGTRTQTDFANINGNKQGLRPDELGKAYYKSGFKTTPLSNEQDVLNSMQAGKPVTVIQDLHQNITVNGQNAVAYHSTVASRIRIYPSGAFKINLMNPSTSGTPLINNKNFNSVVRYLFSVYK